jgi:ribonucleoside-diphosphate reductase alpha chain
MKKLSSIYQPQGLAQEIFNDRYTIYEGEKWVDASYRLAQHVASAETQSIKQGMVAEEFFEAIATNKFMPGGRIWYGAGRERAQLLNCFVVPTHDSREGWGKTVYDTIVISGMGGGVGINCSPIRPRGSSILGTGGKATGAVSLMEMINGVGNVIVGGGGRRMALMLDLNIDHPDLMEFLDKKLDHHELNNANVSVVMNNDPRMFIDQVRRGGNYPLKFEGRENEDYGSVNAKGVWEKIVNNAWQSGEPGVLNGYLANKESNIWYHKQLVSTNPCGEIWLEEYGCCDLGALVLPRFVDDLGAFKWDDFTSTIRTAVRFLDNVLTVNHYPIPEISSNSQNVRRIGLGIMGLHSMLIKMGIPYSSDSARTFIDTLMQVLKVTAYDASVDLAIEKGPFAAFDRKFLDSGYVRRAIPKYIRDRIGVYGIRNCALLTIAPTGTTGMVSDVSTGIEPIFAPAYWRRFYKPTNDGSRLLDKELVINPLWDDLKEQGRDLSVLEGAYDISPEQHFEIQKICQDHIDNATSKTINLPADFKVDTLSDLWLEYLPYLKGTTFYRAGSRGEEPLEAIPLEEAKRLVNGGPHLHGTVAEENMMDCVDGVCEVPDSLKPSIELHSNMPVLQMI